VDDDPRWRLSDVPMASRPIKAPSIFPQNKRAVTIIVDHCRRAWPPFNNAGTAIFFSSPGDKEESENEAKESSLTG